MLGGGPSGWGPTRIGDPHVETSYQLRELMSRSDVMNAPVTSAGIAETFVLTEPGPAEAEQCATFAKATRYTSRPWHRQVETGLELPDLLTLRTYELVLRHEHGSTWQLTARGRQLAGEDAPGDAAGGSSTTGDAVSSDALLATMNEAAAQQTSPTPASIARAVEDQTPDEQLRSTLRTSLEMLAILFEISPAEDPEPSGFRAPSSRGGYGQPSERSKASASDDSDETPTSARWDAVRRATSDPFAWVVFTDDAPEGKPLADCSPTELMEVVDRYRAEGSRCNEEADRYQRLVDVMLEIEVDSVADLSEDQVLEVLG